jgi:hypothetical protein
MSEGLLLLGVCIMMVLLIRWLLAHDSTSDGKSDGLFALREFPPKKMRNTEDK